MLLLSQHYTMFLHQVEECVRGCLIMDRVASSSLCQGECVSYVVCTVLDANTELYCIYALLSTTLSALINALDTH